MNNTSLDVDYEQDLALYVFHRMNGGDFGDQDESDGQGSGMARFGRRIYWWTDMGNDGLDTYDTVDAAITAFFRIQTLYYSDCEKCGESVHIDEMSQYEHTKYECGTTDFNFLKVSDNSGVAWRIVNTYPLLGRVDAVMVGDDVTHNLDWDDLTIIDDDDYCSECGQIGCTADGR